MEASEQRRPTRGAGRRHLRLVDPARIIDQAPADRRESGLLRLHLMTQAVLDRMLAADPSQPER